MNITALPEADFCANPVLFVELAHAWVAGGPPPDLRHEELIRCLPRPVVGPSAAAREALWGALSYPERCRALTWLDRVGLLADLIPVWAGDPRRRQQRLAAVEEVHYERWAGGLGTMVYEWLCVYQDQKVGLLGGWAIAGLATLLLEGDEPTLSQAARVRQDLKVLGARPEVVDRVVLAILEYPDLRASLLGEPVSPGRNANPTTVVATLSSLLAQPDIPMARLRGAISAAGKLLMRFAAPDTEPAHRRL